MGSSRIRARRRITALVLGVGVLLAQSPAQADEPARAPQTTPEDAAGAQSLLVRFAAGTDSAKKSKTAKDAGGEVVRSVGATGFTQVAVGDEDPVKVARHLARSGVVEVVEPDRIRHAAAAPNDQFYGDQAGYLQAAGFPATWDRVTGSDNLTLAVLDSGVDLTHADLSGRLLGGRDIVGNDNTPADDQGHGTMVTGVAGARTNNGAGVAGGTWKGAIMPVKVLDAAGAATDADIAAGITWAVDRGADVINLSLGGPGSSTTLQTAIDYATSRNVVVVAAAGNSGTDADPHYPAAAVGVVAVGASDANGGLASFSNFGSWVDLVAPGVNLMTTSRNGTYSRASGTSFSTPLVAAAAMLLRAADPSASQATIADRLRRGAKDAGAPGTDNLFGAGILDVAGSLRLTPGFQTGSTAGTITRPVATSGPGYWMLGSEGRVYEFGSAEHYGEPVDGLGGSPAADLEPAPGGLGYWVVGAAGQVFGYGSAGYFGGLSAPLRTGESVTSLSATSTGKGYWLFTTAGRAFAFGDAGFLGDMAAVALNAPVLDSIPTPSGKGYYMVAADGGIFTFGDAGFAGSLGNLALNAPVESLVPDPDGTGYWLVANDGGVFAFDAPFQGSLGSIALNAPVVGMVAFGNGYLMAGADGGVFNFSNQAFVGSLGDNPPANPVVSMAALAR